MAGDLIDSGIQSFSTTVGLLYVFNLIVGTGALALPKAFQDAGYLLSVIFLIISAFTSYVCVTFILECLSIANAVIKLRTNSHSSMTPSSSSETLASNNRLTNSLFDITQRVEVSEMSHIFLCRFAVFFTYSALSIYLFGDLAIYSATVPKSLMNVVCSPLNSTMNDTIMIQNLPCFSSSNFFPAFLTRFFVYRFCVVIFGAFCLPMVLAGMTRTKYVQLATTISRWTAFTLMIVLATIQLLSNGAQGSPPATDFHSFSKFFGVAVYAFMCHHSIPGLVAPMRDSTFLSYRLILVYVMIFLFYCTLSLTGSFAFKTVHDVYTLNFLHDDQKGNIFYFLTDYFLTLFPVFTLTSSYIIVAITLTNNVRVLLKMAANTSGTVSRRTDSISRSGVLHYDSMENPEAIINAENEALLNEESSEDDEGGGRNLNRQTINQEVRDLRTSLKGIMLPASVIILPTLLSLATDNVLLLASITGSYPGVGVQFIIPAILVLGARSHLHKNYNSMVVPKENASPFHHWFWPFLVIGWATFAMIIVTVNIFHFI